MAIPGIPHRLLQHARLVLRKVRVSIFTPCVSISRDSRSPEEKPITVDRPNRTYVLYRASAMKFDTKGETRNETPSHACAQKSNMCSIGRRAKQTSRIEGLRTRASRRTNEARYHLNYRRPYSTYTTSCDVLALHTICWHIVRTLHMCALTCTPKKSKIKKTGCT